MAINFAVTRFQGVVQVKSLDLFKPYQSVEFGHDVCVALSGGEVVPRSMGMASVETDAETFLVKPFQ
jgi:hypothetical protein